MKTIWTTKTGQNLKICDMDTSHIKNCINMLERKQDYKFKCICSWSPHGDMAEFYLENEIENIYENGWDDEIQEYIDAFKSELSSRQTI